MTEPTPIILSSPDAGARSAGDILRLAREAQKQTIESLASTIKVSPAKLYALESAQYDSLPDANFTRALAMTVCRALKIDSADVLAALPAATPTVLAAATPPLNQPFKDRRAGVLLPAWLRVSNLSALWSFKWMAPIALLAAAAFISSLPEQIEWPAWMRHASHAAVAPAGTDPVNQVASQPQTTEGRNSVVTDEASSSAQSAAPRLVLDAADASASAVVVAPPADPRLTSSMSKPVASSSGAVVDGPLVLNVTATSWIDVRDASGVKLLSQQVGPGEVLSLRGVPPLRLLVGNAAGVNVSYKGVPVDLASQTKSNVARMELK